MGIELGQSKSIVQIILWGARYDPNDKNSIRAVISVKIRYFLSSPNLKYQLKLSLLVLL